MAFGASTYVISPGYLQTVKTPLVAGRDFTMRHDDGIFAKSSDCELRPLPVNYTGTLPQLDNGLSLWETAKYEVVGVVEDGKYNSIGEDPEPMMLIPLAQGIGEVKSTFTTVIVRSQLPED